MQRRMTFGWWIAALALGCGGATFTSDDRDAGSDASSTGSGSTTTSGSTTSGGSTTSTGTGSGSSGTSSTSTGSTTTSTSSTTGTGGSTATGGSGGTGGRGGAGGSSGSGGSATGGGGSGTGGSRGGNAGAGGMSGGDAGVDWSQCTGPGQCSAQIKGCCGPCGMPMVEHFAGVNPKFMDAFKVANCPVPTPCPLCLMSPNPYIGARCVGTHCQPFDTRQVPEFSKCVASTDCRLRKGLDCCECGSVAPWTAVSIDQSALIAAVCAPNTPCDACLPVPPPDLQAVCVQGRCAVSTLTP